MKKLIYTLALLLLSLPLFANAYKIVDVQYNITPCSWPFLGVTKQNSLENNVPLNKTKTFESVEELETYLSDYKQRLSNTRAFDKIDVSYDIKQNTSLNEVYLKVSLTDTVHLLAVPYPKYDSNSGVVFKIKAKDTNFLGTMNPMSTDINFSLDNTESEKQIALGFNFDYDYPFKAGIFNATWVNSHALDYTFGEDAPDWNSKTGLRFVLPKPGISFVFDLYQYASYNNDFISYNDALYFTQYAAFSMPISLFEINNFGTVTTTPSISFTHNWDKDGIDPFNTSLSSPTMKIGNNIAGSRINWRHNFRTGVMFNLGTYIDYNFQRKTVIPYITNNVSLFKSFTISDNFVVFKRFGLCADLEAFYYFNDKSSVYAYSDGKSIGSSLRGIKDSQGYANESGLGNSTTVPTAFVFNFDLPLHIFSTNFDSKVLKHFNFDLQFSPFFDMALTYNKATKQYFNLKDGFYGAGFEVLVYPKKWSSFVVRGSLGFDIGRLLLEDHLNTDWRKKHSAREVSIGIGLHY